MKAIEHWDRLSFEHSSREGIEFFGTTTPDFRRAIVETYLSVSPTIRSLLEEKGVRIFVGGIKTDIWPENVLGKSHASDDHPNERSASFWARASAIGISQHVHIYGGSANELTLEGLEKRQWLWSEGSDKSAKTDLLHELGHALDYHLGEPSKNNWFREAYEKDIAALGGIQGAKNKGWDYYVQEGNPALGYAETFAEIFSLLNGGERNNPITAAFPSTTKAIKHYMAKFELEAAQGPKAIQRFINATFDESTPLVETTIENYKLVTNQLEADLLAGTALTEVRKSGDEYLLSKFNSIQSELKKLSPPESAILRAAFSTCINTVLRFVNQDKLTGEIDDLRGCLSIARQMEIPLGAALQNDILDVHAYALELVAQSTNPPRPHKLESTQPSPLHQKNAQAPSVALKKLAFTKQDGKTYLGDEKVPFDARRILTSEQLFDTLAQHGTETLMETSTRTNKIVAFPVVVSDDPARQRDDAFIIFQTSGRSDTPIVIVGNEPLTPEALNRLGVNTNRLAYFDATMGSAAEKISFAFKSAQVSSGDLLSAVSSFVDVSKEAQLRTAGSLKQKELSLIELALDKALSGKFTSAYVAVRGIDAAAPVRKDPFMSKIRSLLSPDNK
jgi:hypothetical protein